MRTVHFFGLDAETRNQVAKGFSDKMGGFFCTDRELPTASTESPFARWLRTIGTVAREQFRDNPEQYANTMSVWVDTIDEADAVNPPAVPNAPSDFRWEKPSEDEYHFVITKSIGSIDSMIAQVVLQYDRHFS